MRLTNGRLLSKLAASLSTLEQVISELAHSGASTARPDTQLQRHAGLQASIGLASAAALNTLSGEINGAVAKSQILS